MNKSSIYIRLLSDKRKKKIGSSFFYDFLPRVCIRRNPFDFYFSKAFLILNFSSSFNFFFVFYLFNKIYVQKEVCPVSHNAWSISHFTLIKKIYNQMRENDIINKLSFVVYALKSWFWKCFSFAYYAMHMKVVQRASWRIARYLVIVCYVIL